MSKKLLIFSIKHPMSNSAKFTATHWTLRRKFLLKITEKAMQKLKTATVRLGYYMEKTEQNNIVGDRELNIQKVQVLMNYCQTRINVMYSYLIAFLVGFIIFLGTLYYQGDLNVFRFFISNIFYNK
jgi:hypothetical protein